MINMDIYGLKSAFNCLKKIMDKNRETLIELDSVMGDGDLGITMQKAFTSAQAEAQIFESEELGDLMIKIGMKISQSAPSTMGTLLAKGFISGGKSIPEIKTLSLSNLAVFFRAFTQGIMDAGKTKPGNKTIVDALYPASTAMEKASAENKLLAEGIESAYLESLKGVENTKSMKAQHGRAAYYQEKSIGVIDAGAKVGSLILEGFYLAVSE